LLAPPQKIQNRANRAGLVVPHYSLQPDSDRFNVTSMAVFCKDWNSPPSLDLSRIVPPIAQPKRLTHRHIARFIYLEADKPRTDY